MAKSNKHNNHTTNLYGIISRVVEELKSLGEDRPQLRKERDNLIKLHGEIKFEEIADGLGCINTNLLFQSLETDLRITGGIDGVEVEIEIVDGTNGKLLINHRTGKPYTLHEYIQKASRSEELGLLFGDGTKSSTAPTPSIKNPWKKETFNLTEQMRLLRENPSQAVRLKAEAKE